MDSTQQHTGPCCSDKEASLQEKGAFPVTLSWVGKTIGRSKFTTLRHVVAFRENFYIEVRHGDAECAHGNVAATRARDLRPTALSHVSLVSSYFLVFPDGQGACLPSGTYTVSYFSGDVSPSVAHEGHREGTTSGIYGWPSSGQPHVSVYLRLSCATRFQGSNPALLNLHPKRGP